MKCVPSLFPVHVHRFIDTDCLGSWRAIRLLPQDLLVAQLVNVDDLKVRIALDPPYLMRLDCYPQLLVGP